MQNTKRQLKITRILFSIVFISVLLWNILVYYDIVEIKRAMIWNTLIVVISYIIMGIVLPINAVLDKNKKKINTNTTQENQNTIEINDKK